MGTGVGTFSHRPPIDNTSFPFSLDAINMSGYCRQICRIYTANGSTRTFERQQYYDGGNKPFSNWEELPTRAEMDTLKVGTPINHMRFFGNNNKTYDILRFCYDESESEYIQVIFDVNDKSIALYKKLTDGTETFIGKVTLT